MISGYDLQVGTTIVFIIGNSIKNGTKFERMIVNGHIGSGDAKRASKDRLDEERK